MPRVETTLDGFTKDAFHALAKRSGVTEAALLRRVIATLVRMNPSGPVNKDVEDRRSLRISVGVTPVLYEAVTQAARNAHTSRQAPPRDVACCMLYCRYNIQYGPSHITRMTRRFIGQSQSAQDATEDLRNLEMGH